MYVMQRSVLVCVLVLPLLSTSLHINRQTNEQENKFEVMDQNTTYMGSTGRLNPLHRVSDNELCPIWSVRGKDGKCECGRDLNGIVQCDPETKELSVLDCYCIPQMMEKL